MAEQKQVVADDADLYARLAPDLTAFATGLVGANDAADVVSSALVRVLSSAAWRTATNKRAYLYRSVFNEAMTWTKRSSRRRAREREATPDEQLTFLPSFRPEVREAVERLSVQQRAVVLLTYWADLDTTTVAEQLGISDGAVRRHLARARARLRKVLDD
jgi:RNA polymerase sigma-70 factor (ECF subfamily)